MAACNSFCKLPTQDGERVEGERGLHSAEDIIYWTDNTYTTEEVLDMEARLLLHLDECGGVALCADAPVHYLCTYCAALPQLDDAAASIALELLVMCTREYRLLQTPPNLLAACCLGLAVWNYPANTACSHEWDAAMVSYTGFGAAALVAWCDAELHMLRDKHVSCRSIASGLRGRSIHATIMFMDMPT